MNDRDWPLTEKDFPAANPYAATAYSSSAPAGDFGSQASAEEVRRKFLKHEASVQSIGSLYLFGVVILLFAAGVMIISLIVGVVNGTNGGDATPDTIASVITTVMLLAIAGLQYWVGMGLRTLQSPARVVAIIFSVIGLLGIPIGTLINGYFLYLLLGQKGTYVFSEEYARVRAATPHIKYKTSIWVLVGVALLVVVFVIGIVALVATA